ncbi:DUF2905 domain-containing protein [Caldalkalibacillus salinus]|uniref:DUF2905 domain-containing protein n=1 Tax=Caldalkalibacillus salinus TaxID=2803787 RepID=UPI0019249BCE|nr:DUF2905 domain-containing protein [Caldalkalibacillus salinus]
MNPIAKWIMITGGVLIVVGLLWQLLGRHIPLGRLPGDFVYEKENVRVYFPFVTMIILSIVLSLLFSLGRFFR